MAIAPVDTDRWETAIHEAGHAVIGRILGMRCGHATINADHDSAGHGMIADPWAIASSWEAAGKHRDMASVWRGRIMAFQAGTEAVAEIVGVPPTGEVDDRYQVALMMEQFDCDDAGEKRLRRYTRQLGRRHRSTIERVAVVLMKRGQLSGAQIDGMVWPRGALAGFVGYPDLRRRFNIAATRQRIMQATRVGMFPRAWMFNGKLRWRVRDVEAWVASRRA